MAIKEVINLDLENSLIHPIHTSVKGRARYKISGLYKNPLLRRYLESKLLKSPIITRVSASDLTGNILVYFDLNQTQEFVAQIIHHTVGDYYQGNTIIPTAKQEPQQHLPLSTKQVQILEEVGEEVALASSAVVTLLCGAGLVHLYGLDKAILLAIQKIHTPILDGIMIGVTSLAEPLAMLTVCSGFAVGAKHFNRPILATNLGIAAVGAVGLNYLLKEVFGRARPALWNHIVDVGHYSFPSGHAMVSLVMYGFIGYVLAKQYPQWRRQIYASTASLILAIGFSRLYLGVHWATDVIVGYAAGLIWLVTCTRGLELEEKYFPPSSNPVSVLG